MVPSLLAATGVVPMALWVRRGPEWMRAGVAPVSLGTSARAVPREAGRVVHNLFPGKTTT